MSNVGYLCFHHSYDPGSGISQIRKRVVTDSLLSSFKFDKIYSLCLSPESLPEHLHSGEPAGKTSNLNLKLITKLEEILQLSFIYKEETVGKVCMARSEEVRPDFRESFTLKNLLNYILGFIHSEDYRQKLLSFPEKGLSAVPLPQDPDDLWRMASKRTRINLTDHSEDSHIHS